jgi:hypothetical protein
MNLFDKTPLTLALCSNSINCSSERVSGPAEPPPFFLPDIRSVACPALFAGNFSILASCSARSMETEETIFSGVLFTMRNPFLEYCRKVYHLWSAAPHLEPV